MHATGGFSRPTRRSSIWPTPPEGSRSLLLFCANCFTTMRSVGFPALPEARSEFSILIKLRRGRPTRTTLPRLVPRVDSIPYLWQAANILLGKTAYLSKIGLLTGDVIASNFSNRDR